MTTSGNVEPATREVAGRGLAHRADLWAGLLCLAFGGGVLWVGADYPQGSGGRIGPGYAPRLLGIACIVLGLSLAGRAQWTRDRVETLFRARPVLLVLASVLTFAVVFAWVGLAPAIVAAVLVANFATSENGWTSAVVLSVLLALFSWLLFVKALKLPMPVIRL